ncbi:MAG: arginase family protein [Chloroflexi bacterium]|nr:arginase family protein [Chloroflexota bacterium]MBP7045169.1 arginase family protein [Chloroflexota bacterium]
MTDQFVLTPYFLDSRLPGLDPLTEAGWQTNLPPISGEDKQARMISLYRPLAGLVSAAILQGRRPVSVAGDCCTTIGVLSGLQQAGVIPTLIWFDAHGDFNTWETTPSGFLGGMPLAMAVGLGEQTLPQGVGLRPLPFANVILTDGRDLDPDERTLVEQSGITHLPDVTALLEYPLPDGPLYVHFDTDVVDPAEVPAMNYPAPGGPSAETLRRVFRHLAATGRVTAVSLSAWNPDMDEDGRSRAISMSLLQELLANSTRQKP